MIKNCSKKFLTRFNALVAIFCFSVLDSPTVNAMTFAAVGDYGDLGSGLRNVSKLIHSWDPEFVITLGDNDYEGDYTRSVKPYYRRYISSDCSSNRFFPSFGNHDWYGKRGYDDVFPCTGTRYKFKKGNVEFFTINSDSMSSSQASWLKSHLQDSTATWKIVFFHHSPYSSSEHGSDSSMQLDYAGWGADLVVSGHDHVYERIERNGIVYLVNGLGGRRGIYDFDNCCVSGSKKRYNNNYGALRFDVNGGTMRIRFITRTPTVRDDFTLTKSTNPIPAPGDPNSCASNCGGQTSGGCYCDSACTRYGDCCRDYQNMCR